MYVNSYIPTESPEEDLVVIGNHQADYPLHVGANCLIWCFAIQEWRDGMFILRHSVVKQPLTFIALNF